MSLKQKPKHCSARYWRSSTAAPIFPLCCSSRIASSFAARSWSNPSKFPGPSFETANLISSLFGLLNFFFTASANSLPSWSKSFCIALHSDPLRSSHSCMGKYDTGTPGPGLPNLFFWWGGTSYLLKKQMQSSLHDFLDDALLQLCHGGHVGLACNQGHEAAHISCLRKRTTHKLWEVL